MKQMRILENSSRSCSSSSSNNNNNSITCSVALDERDDRENISCDIASIT
jgi:hypothetical protein